MGGRAAHMGAMVNVYKTLLGKPERKIPIEAARRRRKNNIKNESE
jgi:hypothetical protein